MDKQIKYKIRPLVEKDIHVFWGVYKKDVCGMRTKTTGKPFETDKL